MSARSSPPDSSKDEPPKSPASTSQTQKQGPQFKNRIQSWLKDAEEDAEKADQYLDKKREKKESKRDIVDKTDVIKTMEAIEKVRCCIRRYISVRNNVQGDIFT